MRFCNPSINKVRSVSHVLDIQSPIDCGRYGVVYKARAVVNQQCVAVKKLLKDRHDMPSFINHEMIQWEVDNWDRVTGGPHICDLKNIFEDEEAVYMVMPYIPTGTLQSKLDASIKWNTLQLKCIARGLAIGVRMCHVKNVIHGDIKPSNILMLGEYFPLLCDFGCSRHVPDDIGPCIGGVRFGTPHYIAPEVSKFGKTCFKSDVYAIGVLLRDLLRLNSRDVSLQDYESAMDLVVATLQEDVDKRCDIHEFLDHPWFTIRFADMKAMM